MTESAERRLPPYARVVADIRARITSGEIAPGSRVPSTREITREWGVAMATATKALAALRQEGLVEAVRGVGTVVRSATGPAAAPTPGPAAPKSVLTPKPEPAAAPARGEDRPRTAAAGRRRVPEGALNRETVVRAAIAIADAEGIGLLSMRRISTELQVSTMALYRHVASKDELLAAMIDQVYGEVALPEPPHADWRQTLELALHREWGIFRRHPWAVSLATVTRPILTPRLVENGEWIMSLLTGCGCSPDDALRIMMILNAYLSGMALEFAQVTELERETGMDSEGFWLAKRAELASEDIYPNVFQVSAPPEFDIDGTFDLGMAHLLDGITPLIEQRRQEK